MPSPVVVTPYRSLLSDNYISSGSTGNVYAVGKHTVIKCLDQLDNPTLYHQDGLEYASAGFQLEKDFLRVLERYDQHPNVARYLLYEENAFFMERYCGSLSERLDNDSVISTALKAKWVRQLVSAMAWLESIGYAHGDLRTDNILLDDLDNVVLADFDAAVKYGQELRTSSVPFYKCGVDVAGPESEQFAVGSCIYSITFGFPPYRDLDAFDQIQKIKARDYPSIIPGHLFGDIIQACWQGRFESMAALKSHLEQSSMNVTNVGLSKHESGLVANANGWLERWFLLSECYLFKVRDRLRWGRGAQMKSRLEYWGLFAVHRVLQSCVAMRRLVRRSAD